ncbi:MAG: sporulation integral membrane protein YtvI [Oscillospiraceae bacterium]
MNSTERKRNFIIKIIFYGIWAALIYCILKYALPFIMPFFLAFIIAFALKPLINLITKKTPLNRRVVAILLLTLVYAIIGTLLVVFGAKLIVYISGVFSNLPKYYYANIEPIVNSISGWIDSLLKNSDPTLLGFFNSVSQNLSSMVSNILSAVSSGAINLVTTVASSVPFFLVTFFLTIIASYFFVIDYYKITSFIARQLTPNANRMLFVIKDFVVNVLLKFLRAYAILMTITFIEVSIGLLILRVPSPFLIALVTAIVDILPVLGTGTIMIPWAAYCLITGNYFLGIGLVVLYAIITVVRQVLEPRVVGKQIGLYPLLTLICMFVGARLFGFWGMLAFPVTVTVIVHLNRSGEISLFKE